MDSTVLIILLVIVGSVLIVATASRGRGEPGADPGPDAEELATLVEQVGALERRIAFVEGVLARLAAPEPLRPAAPPAVRPAVPPPPSAVHPRPVAPLHRPAPAIARSLETEVRPIRPAPEVPPVPAGPGLIERTLTRIGLATEGGQPTRAALEAWLEGRILAVVGGIALVLGAVFFLSLAFSKGWITEELRVVIGLVAGFGMLALGELSFRRERTVVGHVLVAVGLAVVSLAFLAATRLYGLVAVEWGLAGAFAAAIVAAAIAVRHDSQLVATFGLIAVLAAPPVLGASPTLVTLLFVGTTLVATAAISLFRTWSWLPVVAFVLAAPQVASYLVGTPPIAEALVALGGFWLVSTVAAGGEELRHRTERLRAATVSLLLANAVFTYWAGLTTVAAQYEVWRGTFLVVLGLAHVALALGLFVRYGDRHPYGLLVAAAGAAFLTIAAPVQLGGAPVPVAWAAGAVALAAVAVVRRHPYAAALASVLGTLAMGHLVTVEFRPFDLIGHRASGFVGPEAIAAGFVVAAHLVAARIVPVRSLRILLVGGAGLLVGYLLPFELTGPPLVAGWSALAVVAVVARARLAPLGPGLRPTAETLAPLALPAPLVGKAVGLARGLRAAALPVVRSVGVLGAGSAAIHLVLSDFPSYSSGPIPREVPYAGEEGISLAIALGALALGGWLLGTRGARLGATGLGLALVAWTLPFEIAAPHPPIGWGLIVIAALVVVRRLVTIPPLPSTGAWRPGVRETLVAERLPYVAAALATLWIATAALAAAPLGTLLVQLATDGPAAAATPFRDDATEVLVVALLTALAAGIAWGGIVPRVRGVVLAGIALAWLLPEELRTGLAVAGWAVLALAWLVEARRIAAVREVPAARGTLVGAAGGLLVAVAIVAAASVAPLHRLVVDQFTTVSGPWPLTDATLVLGLLAAGLAIAARLHLSGRRVAVAAAAAGATVLYLLSVALVDGFQLQVADRQVADLGREASVGLTVLWSLVGGLVFATGLLAHRPPVRVFGLAVLGIATVKVFLVDLAGLAIEYRVMSLVALGLLLVLSAYLYGRASHPHGPVGHRPA